MNHRNCKIIYSGPHNLYRFENIHYVEPEEKIIRRHAVPSIIEPQETLDIRRNISMIPKSTPQGFRVYGNISASAYLKPNERTMYLLKAGLGNYQIINEYNTDEMLVCVSETPSKEVVICFRGTSLTSYASAKKDLKSDVLIGLSVNEILDKRYKKSLSLSRQILSRFDGYSVIFTGHSLGSAIGYAISDALQCESYSFALPSSLFQLTLLSKAETDIVNLFEKNNYSNKFIYSVRFDPIGEMGMESSIIGVKKYVPALSYNLHSVLNFC